MPDPRLSFRAIRFPLRLAAILLLAACLQLAGCASLQPQPGEAIALVVKTDAARRVAYGADLLAEALTAVGYRVERVSQLADVESATPLVIGNVQQNLPLSYLVDENGLLDGTAPGPEGFLLATLADGAWVVAGNDDSGALYGCLELRDRIAREGRFPAPLKVAESPSFRLRGPCIGMQKPEFLPGRQVYEYPYTPETFPFFYDKEQWRGYLDFLCENRMNTLYLWNGHPFPSLVRLDDYPYAVEAPDDVFEKNVEMYRFLTEEADRRGIWVIQMFYNIYVSKPFAEHNGIGTMHRASTPLVADYNRKSIAKFVEQYPNVGLLVCLGEELRGMENQQYWLNNVVIAGVTDGMKKLELKEEPPIVIRAHSVGDPHLLIQGALPLYKNLYTMAKYNGESLTTYQPRDKWVKIHNALSESGATHVANVHILSNLEPFRYGAQEFIRKCVLAIRDVDHAQGLHLYPLTYWHWPESPDKVVPPLSQVDRDWMWFESWARYTWDADRDPTAEAIYWTDRLAGVYGTRKAGGKILEAYNAAGECAPRLLRWFGITEGNRQTLSLGMTLDQLVNSTKYRTYPELWESHSPPGERIDTYVEREMKGIAHEGETPPFTIAAVDDYSREAVEAIEAAAPHVTANREEFERLRNDMHCIRAMSLFYREKVEAAMAVVRFNHSGDVADMERALIHLEASLGYFRELESLTRDTYRFANSLQTGHRKIPFVGDDENDKADNYHWTQVLPYYEKELVEFRRKVAGMKKPAMMANESEKSIKPLPRAAFKPIEGNGELFEVGPGQRTFTDREYKILDLAPELAGLQGIRFNHEDARMGRDAPLVLEFEQPSRVLVGYIQNENRRWLQPPNLDIDSGAEKWGGVEPRIRNAVTIEELPAVNIHAWRYDAGRHTLDLRGQGSYVVFGVIPADAPLKERDAGRPGNEPPPRN
jgi:hypothetical protein